MRKAEAERIEYFHWTETEERLKEHCALRPLVLDDRGKCFVSSPDEETRSSFTPPLLQRISHSNETPESYLEGLSHTLGTELIILLQAGACALGIWQDDELDRHKTLKKYVKRAHGKAQATYLRTKRKPRYGSRLRLQGAEALLREACEKIAEYREELGSFDAIYFSAPVRQWGELFHAEPSVPFERSDERLVRIPLDVNVPCFKELSRVRRRLERGEIRREGSAPGAASRARA